VDLGETLGQYRVVDVVGQGGMAAVYVGEHVVVQHRVAIKVVHPRHLDNPRMAQRFLNEARAVALIRHPGIVEFYDFGRADDGRAYIVMELLNGETLQQRLMQGPIAVSKAVLFARQMASALGAAHARGIVHRDLKPANVFLVPDPDVRFGERAKILDFGIAKHTTDEREEITGTGVMIGTPAHMSPEQCRGERDIDGRADVYALGVLLYHMVTGRLPFDGSETGEIVSRHLYEQCRAASQINPRVPQAVSDVIAWCMKKDRARRCSSMEELATALSALTGDAVETDKVEKLPPPAPTRTRAAHAVEVIPPTLTPAPVMRSRATKPRLGGSVGVTPSQFGGGTEATAPWSPHGHHTTLQRTIVDAPSWLTRARGRLAELVLGIAATGAVVAATVIALDRVDPGVPAAEIEPSVTRPAAAVTAVEEGEPEIDELEVDRPRRYARQRERDRERERDRDRAKREERIRKEKEEEERQEERAKAEKAEERAKAEKAEKAKPVKAERKEKARPSAKKTAPKQAPSQENPFDAVATPTVY
jgi:serine/threonine protein kinase